MMMRWQWWWWWWDDNDDDEIMMISKRIQQKIFKRNSSQTLSGKTCPVQPLLEKMRFSGQKVLKTKGFLRILFGPVHPSQGKRGSSVKNWRFFAFSVCPKVSWGLCWRFVLPHTAVFSREKKWAKIAKKRQKLGVFGDFSCSKQLSAGIRLSSVKNCGFLAILLCPNLCPHTAFSKPCPKMKRGSFTLVWKPVQSNGFEWF